MSGQEWSEQEWEDYKQWQWQWSDEDWAQYRRFKGKKSSLRTSNVTTQDKDLQAALLGSAKSPSELPVLPEIWHLTAAEKPNNEQHSRKNFADLVRAANRRLRVLYAEWQGELTELKEKHSQELVGAVQAPNSCFRTRRRSAMT